LSLGYFEFNFRFEAFDETTHSSTGKILCLHIGYLKHSRFHRLVNSYNSFNQKFKVEFLTWSFNLHLV